MMNNQEMIKWMAKLSDRDVSLRQGIMMMTLMEDGPQTTSTLGRVCGVSSAAMTGMVDRMEKRGWVERRNDPEDRRSRVVALTDDALKVFPWPEK